MAWFNELHCVSSCLAFPTLACCSFLKLRWRRYQPPVPMQQTPTRTCLTLIWSMWGIYSTVYSQVCTRGGSGYCNVFLYILSMLLVGTPVAPTQRLNSSQRRKQELLNLRAQASQLEEQLSLLNEAASSRHTSGMLSTWRNQAIYNMMERTKAEEVRANLQSQMMNYSKIASDLQTLKRNCEVSQHC